MIILDAFGGGAKNAIIATRLERDIAAKMHAHLGLNGKMPRKEYAVNTEAAAQRSKKRTDEKRRLFAEMSATFTILDWADKCGISISTAGADLIRHEKAGRIRSKLVQENCTRRKFYEKVA